MNEEAPHIILVQRAIILNNDRCFLLLQRKKNGSWLSEKWELPGGKLDRGEELVESLKREVLEETGLKINHITHMTHAQCSWADSQESREVPYITLVTLTNIIKGTVAISEEHKEYKWVSAEEAVTMDLTPTTKEAIHVLRDSIGNSQVKT